VAGELERLDVLLRDFHRRHPDREADWLAMAAARLNYNIPGISRP
jgi:hypothetical protein